MSLRCCGFVTFVLGMNSTTLPPRRLSFYHSTKPWLDGGSIAFYLGRVHLWAPEKRPPQTVSWIYSLVLETWQQHSLSGMGLNVLWSAIPKFVKDLRSRDSARGIFFLSMSRQSEQVAIVLFTRDFLWALFTKFRVVLVQLYIHCS